MKKEHLQIFIDEYDKYSTMHTAGTSLNNRIQECKKTAMDTLESTENPIIRNAINVRTCFELSVLYFQYGLTLSQAQKG